MDTEVARELRKVAASLAVIEDRLAWIEAERRKETETRTEFPPMPFPGFDLPQSSLPI